MRLSRFNILVVDDDLDTLDLLKIAIEKKGYRVMTASSWEEVAERVESTYKLNIPIDLIVLDLMIPERSGFDILRSLQVALVPMPPVIMLTAVTGMDQQLTASEMGITKYITKPTTPLKLITAIRSILKTVKRTRW